MNDDGTGPPKAGTHPRLSDFAIKWRQFVLPERRTAPPEPFDIELLTEARKFLLAATRDQPSQSTIWEGEISQSGLAQLHSALMASEFDEAHQLLENFWLLDKGRIGGTYLKFQMNAPKRWRFLNWTRTLLDRFRLSEKCTPEELCVASTVGNPAGFKTVHGIVNPISIRHAYDARALARLSKGGALLEIGGAHGGLAAKIIQSGAYSKYIDCDLPIMLCVAYYYLSKTFPDLTVTLLSPKAEAEVARERLDNSDILLLSAHNSGILAEIEYDGVFNSYSFSEMTIQTVTDYIRAIEASDASFVLHENYSGYGRQHPHLVPALSFPFAEFKMVSNGFTLDPKNLDCQRYLLMRETVSGDV